MKDWQRARNRIAKRVEAEVPRFRFARRHGTPSFGGACPWQADGYVDDQACYLRFRHNQASMTVYDRDFDRWQGGDEVAVLSSVIYPYYPEGHPEHHVHTGQPLDEDIPEMIRRLVEELAPVSEENPTSGMILKQAVDELVGKLESGELTTVTRRTRIVDELEVDVVSFVETDPS